MALIVLLLTQPVLSNEQTDYTAEGEDISSLSLEEVSRRLENPLTDLWSLTFQNNLTILEGDALESDEIQNVAFFQPFMPFALGEDKGTMFTLRPVFPWVSNPEFSQPVISGEQQALNKQGRESGLGDIQLLTLAGPNRQDGVVWGLGTTLKMPTASDEAIGQKKWQAGPAAMFFYIGKPWVTGVLAQH